MGAVLTAVRDVASARGGEARLSHVATKANLPYDRLVQYVAELERNGLVTVDGTFPRLTSKGHEFLREYRQWLTVLERFGLGER